MTRGQVPNETRHRLVLGIGPLFLAMLPLVLGPLVPNARAIPAFARKYGLACTGCHEAWPTLNDFGQAFRDNGYQMLRGEDSPAKVSPGYWPVSIRITPHYEYNSLSNQTTDQGTMTLGNGSVSEVGLDLLSAGTLARNASFLVVMTGFTEEEGVSLEAAWLRFDNLAHSGWLNVLLGKHELDLPRSEHRAWSLTEEGYLIYPYHPPGSEDEFNMAENERGIEYVGHDHGSFNRLAVSVFDVQGSPGSSNVFETPGVYAHATHEWLLEKAAVSAARLGAFYSYTTWPTEFLTSGGEPIDGTGYDLKRATKYGGELQMWFGPQATPLHAFLVVARGEDSPALIPGATRDGTFHGGFLELGYTPALTLTIFARADQIRNDQQGDPGTPQTFGDQDAYTVGIRKTIHYSTRSAFALHGEYANELTKGGAEDGSDLRAQTVFAGVDFGY